MQPNGQTVQVVTALKIPIFINCFILLSFKFVGWRRLESTHLDHLEEGGHGNVSIITEDFSAIPALEDSFLTFYTAKNSVRPSLG